MIFFWIAIVTGCARRSLQGLRVTVTTGSATMVNSSPAFIRNFWMRTVITSEPVIGCMATRAIQAEHSGMEDRIPMTAGTVRG